MGVCSGSLDKAIKKKGLFKERGDERCWSGKGGGPIRLSVLKQQFGSFCKHEGRKKIFRREIGGNRVP